MTAAGMRDTGAEQVPDSRRIAAIEGLRGLAAVAVLIQHAASSAGVIHGAAGGFWLEAGVAVPIFFMVSGFALYRPFTMWIAGLRPQPSVRRFFLRRALRIGPAYWLALSVLAIYPSLPDFRATTAPIYYGFGQVYFTDKVFGGIGPAWTLCVEVTFYVALISIALLAGSLAKKRAGAEVAILTGLLAAAISFHLVPLWSHHGASYFRANHTLVGTLDWFLIGMLFATAASGHAPRVLTKGYSWLVTHPWHAWAVAAAIFVAHALTERPHQEWFAIQPSHPNVSHLTTTIEALLIFGPTTAGLAFATRARAVLTNRVVLLLGACSYGIYIWHRPIVQVFYDQHSAWHLPTDHVVPLSLFAGAVTVALAMASWHFVERPLIEIGRASRVGDPVRGRPQPVGVTR